MDNTESIVSRLSTRFENYMSVSIDNKHRFAHLHSFRSNRPYIGELTDYYKDKIRFHHTLIDRFFEMFNTNLIYHEKSKTVIIGQLHIFCQRHKLKLKIINNDRQRPNGFIYNSSTRLKTEWFSAMGYYKK